jgi:hypothetical protein
MSKRIDEVLRAGAHALRGAALRTVFVTALIAVASGAQAQTAEDQAGYLTTGDGRPVTDASGDCWHTGEWARGMYYRRCDAPPMKAARAAPVTVETSAEPRTPVEHAKIRPALDVRKLSAEGLGSSKPVTAAGQCRDMHGKQLVRCLQPDRYTELDVAGSAPDAAISRAILSLESQGAAA